MDEIRVIQNDDINSVLNIYKPYILNTASTFEIEVPTLEVFSQRVNDIKKKYPWLVFQRGDKILGYAYASPHRNRYAYQWSVETSIYLDGEYARQGIGRLLYKVLLRDLEDQGIVNVYAGVTLPNDPSIFFHENFGFEEIGIYRKIGYKFNYWHDVIWYLLRINDPTNSQERPIPFSQLKRRE